ncbi:hypothetical protein CBFG_02266 [Clostridiales bacterium 1_7_47FAA]|nr:hypothetical protein CBFG_02266 [Clostridiales bacterium 1_7_47FAA]
MLRGGHHGQIRRVHDNPGLAGKGGSLKGKGHGLKDTLFILCAVDGILYPAVEFRGKVFFQVLECIDGFVVAHRLLVPNEYIQGSAGNQGGYLGKAGVFKLGHALFAKTGCQALIYLNQVLFAKPKGFLQAGFQVGRGTGVSCPVIDNGNGQPCGEGLSVQYAAKGPQCRNRQDKGQDMEFIVFPDIPCPVFGGHVP